MKKTVEFGYCPAPLDWSIGDVRVASLTDLGETVKALNADAGVENGWIYPPRQRSRDFMTGAVTEHPYSSRIFGLSKTHLLEHQCADSDEHLEFLVWCLSFFLGMRLTTTEAGFVDATPSEPGVLHDIVWCGKDSLPKALGFADQFWKMNVSNPRISKSLAGIIHTLFLSQRPQALEFERFIYLYVALEGCHFVRSTTQGRDPRSGGHASRIESLCTVFGMEVPSWARSATASVANTRHATMHEGLFFDEPLGFALFGGSGHSTRAGNTILDMQHLVCRLLIALLGVPAQDYIRSPINDRQQIGVRL